MCTSDALLTYFHRKKSAQTYGGDKLSPQCTPTHPAYSPFRQLFLYILGYIYKHHYVMEVSEALILCIGGCNMAYA